MANSPYSETVISGVISAIDAVTVPNGDNNTIESVVRWDRYTGHDGARPSVTVRSLGEVYSDAGDSERDVTLQLEVIALLEYDPDSGVESDKQVSLLGFDICSALTGIDYTSVGYDVGQLIQTPLIEEDEDDPVDGVRIVANFTYSVDRTDIHTLTGPG